MRCEISPATLGRKVRTRRFGSPFIQRSPAEDGRSLHRARSVSGGLPSTASRAPSHLLRREAPPAMLCALACPIGVQDASSTCL